MQKTISKIILTELAGPAVRRVGTAFGAYLVGVGIHTDTATQIAAGTVALLGVALDLLTSHLNRKGWQ